MKRRPGVYEISVCDAGTRRDTWAEQLERNVAYVGKAEARAFGRCSARSTLHAARTTTRLCLRLLQDVLRRLKRYVSKTPGEREKMVMLNGARLAGYNIYVRVRYVLRGTGNEDSREEEWMGKFDYAWNKMLNGARRDFPAPPFPLPVTQPKPCRGVRVRSPRSSPRRR